MLKVFSVGLVRSIINFQNEEEWEVEDSDEEEE